MLPRRSPLRLYWDEPTPVHTVGIGPFVTERGFTIDDARLGYCCYGTDRSNPLVVLHPALTGSPRASLSGAAAGTRPSQGDGWWDRMIGPGRLLDPHEVTIIVLDHLGGSGHSTGGAELWDLRGSLTFRDSVLLAANALRVLGIERIHCVIGGSIGGAQALQWLFQQQIAVDRIIDLSGSAGQCLRSSEFFEIQADLLETHASGEALASRLETNITDLIGRRPLFDYLASSVIAEIRALIPGTNPETPLALARKVGFLRFVAPPFFDERAERSGIGSGSTFGALAAIRGWLDHQAESFVRRFSSPALGTLCRMNVNTAPLSPEGIARALALASTRLLSFSVHGDTLFPALAHLDFFSRVRDALGPDHAHLFTGYYAIDEVYGHDHFLTERFSAHVPHLHNWLITAGDRSGPRRLRLSRSGRADHPAHLYDLDVRARESGRL